MFMKRFVLNGKILYILLVTALLTTNARAQYAIRIRNSQELQQFFGYNGKPFPIISGHRGTNIKGYPENSIEAFEYVLKHTPAFFEIDPRLTKDSMVILLHDDNLERTTNGKGKVSDYTWAELQHLYLKDIEGNITPYKIPTLAETIEWARGRTILDLDKKDVPLATTAKIIRDMNAWHFVIVTVHNAEQAAFYYQQNNQQMMSAFVKNVEEMYSYEKAGVPWKNMIAYVGSQNVPEIQPLMDSLHARGVMCMISAAPKYDKLPTEEERARAYRAIFERGTDILESDLPIEVAKVTQIHLGDKRKKYLRDNYPKKKKRNR